MFLGHLSRSGNLLLLFGVRCRPSCHERRASCASIFFSRTTGSIVTKFGMKHLYDNETRNDKFMTLHPRGGYFGVKKEGKIDLFLSESSYLLRSVV